MCGERIHLIGSYDSLLLSPVAGVWWAHTLDCLYDSLSSPPVAGVWWAHTLDCLYVSLSSPPVAGVWWAHTLDWLYDFLSSPPVAGVWWAHTLDWLYDFLSSPPVAGVWWAHTLDCLYDFFSSPPVAGVWWAHTLDWLYISLLIGWGLLRRPWLIRASGGNLTRTPGVTPLLFTRSAMGFLMTTESQDPRFNVSSERRCLLTVLCPRHCTGVLGLKQITGWAPPAGLTNTSSNSNANMLYHYGCQYFKGTTQMLIAVCVVEFTGLHSNFLVWELQAYTVNVTVGSVNMFKVLLYFLLHYKKQTIFLQCTHILQVRKTHLVRK